MTHRLVPAAMVIAGLMIVGCESRAARERRELAALVTALGPFAQEIRQANAKLAEGASFKEFLERLHQAEQKLPPDRPQTQSDKVDNLWEKARGVAGSVRESSDRAVRRLAGAQGDQEAQQATVGAMQQIVGDYQAAAGAFLQDFDAAVREVGATR